MKSSKKKLSTKKHSAKPSLIEKPNKEDVVFTCGKGNLYSRHFGNLHYKNLVLSNLFNYKNRHVSEKRAICRFVYNSILQRGGRIIQIDSRNDHINPENHRFFEKSFDDARDQILMAFRNAGKENPEVYCGNPTSPPHADLSTILSQLFKNLTQQQLSTFLTDPDIVDKVTQHLNGLSQLLQLQQTFHFQPLLKPTSSTTSSQFRSEPQQNCKPTLSSTNQKADEEIGKIYNSYQQDTDKVPSTDSLLLTTKTTPASVTPTYNRKFFFDAGVINSNSWPELLSRQINGDVVKRTVLTYAFEQYSIHKIIAVRAKSNKTIRVYKCASCPNDLSQGWSVQVRKIPNTDKLWAVVPFRGGCLSATNIGCDCVRKDKISDYLFLNSSLTRDYVSKNYWASSAHISKTLVTLFKERKGVFENQLPMLSHRKEAIDFLVSRALDKLRHRYHQLPEFVRSLLWKNSMVSVALQGTSGIEPKFHRLFIGFPIACLGHHVHIPVLFIDFYHYQCPQYDGRLASLSSKLGDGSTVVLATAIIPNEDVNNIAWFIQLCSLHGIDFDCALFTDRGHIISAVRQLTSLTKLKFNLMFCLQHLKRNVWHKFTELKKSPLKEKVKALLEKASRAETSAKFLEPFFEFFSLVITREGSTMAMNVARYLLLSIHPSHWTTMANNNQTFCDTGHSKSVNQLFDHLTAAVNLEEHLMSEINDNGEMPDKMQLAQHILHLESQRHQNAPCVIQDVFQNSRKCPRHDENKNNVAESQGNSSIISGVRVRAPPDSVVRILQHNNEKTRKQIDLIIGKPCDFDPSKKVPLHKNFPLQVLVKTAPLPVLMKTAHDHHQKQLRSKDVGKLYMGKENKGKPFIQWSVKKNFTQLSLSTTMKMWKRKLFPSNLRQLMTTKISK